MSNNKALKKVIEKAIRQGFNPVDGEKIERVKVFCDTEVILHLEKRSPSYNYERIIFNPEFGKKYFGEEEMDMAIISPKASGLKSLDLENFKPIRDWKKWEFHLMMMAILSYNERIQYLKEFL